MPSDNEHREASAARDRGVEPAHETQRPERLLGRGLEDISHLFLSQTTDATGYAPGGHDRAPVQSEPWSPPARPSSPPATGSGHVLLRPGAPLTRDQFTAMLKEYDGVLEEGLRSIDTNLPCDPCGVIDVVAVDAARRLVIIDFDVARNDALLLRGLDHVDWAAHNMGNLRRMYPGVDVSRDPRLFLLAPAFSPLLGRVARQVGRSQIVWVKVLVADVFGRTGVLFERVDPS